MQLRQTTAQKLQINDWTGAPTTIKYGPTDKPNIGLGYHLCPNGDQHHQHEHTYNSIKQLCNNVAMANLTEQEAHQTVTQRLVPKLHYPLYLSSFTQKQTYKINTIVRRTFLPPMRFNRHLPSVVLYSPMPMGGMGFPEAYTMQDQAPIPYILKQLRWDKMVANDILVTHDHIQLTSGFVAPILQSTTKPIGHIDNSFYYQCAQDWQKWKDHSGFKRLGRPPYNKKATNPWWRDLRKYRGSPQAF